MLFNITVHSNVVFILHSDVVIHYTVACRNMTSYFAPLKLFTKT
uniref:Uncharacterized protein n=1 Tax=Anguilla anguilla TaxID=7936 RepID=A0A0E9VV01_ANGAN